MKKKTRNVILFSAVMGAIGAAAGYVGYKFIKENCKDKYNLDVKLGETSEEVILKLEEMGFRIAGYSEDSNTVFAYDRHNELIGYNVSFYIAKVYQLPFNKGKYESVSERYPKANLKIVFEDSSVDNPALKSGIALYDEDFGDFLGYFEYNREEDRFM